jgi:hypothetical protein
MGLNCYVLIRAVWLAKIFMWLQTTGSEFNKVDATSATLHTICFPTNVLQAAYQLS